MRYYTLAVFLLTSCGSATDGGSAGFVCPDGWTCSQDATDASDAQPDVIGTEDECGVWYANASDVPECHVVGTSCDKNGSCAAGGACWWKLSPHTPPRWICGPLTDADCQQSDSCKNDGQCWLGPPYGNGCFTEYEARKICEQLTGVPYQTPTDGKCPE